MRNQQLTFEFPTEKQCLEKRNPAEPARARGAEIDLGNVNADDNATDQLVGLAVRRLALRLHVPIYMATVYADLAGLGVAA